VIDLNAFSSNLESVDFETDGDFQYTLGFNSSSRAVLSNYNIPSGDSANVTLIVTRTDALGTSFCSDTLTSSSGLLSCNVAGGISNTTVWAKLYRDGNLTAQGTVKLDNKPSDLFGGIVIFLSIFIFITLLGAGVSDNPIYTIFFLLLGVILLFSLNLVANNGFIGGAATILWLIITIIIVAVKGSRRN